MGGPVRFPPPFVDLERGGFPEEEPVAPISKRIAAVAVPIFAVAALYYIQPILISVVMWGGICYCALRINPPIFSDETV